MSRCALCEREADDLAQVASEAHEDGTPVMACRGFPRECREESRKALRRLDRAAFASLGMTYDDYRGAGL